LTRVAAQRGKDVCVVLNKVGVPQNIICTFGEANEAGTEIEFSSDITGEVKTYTRKLDGVHGLIFKNTLDPKAPPVVCKLLDAVQNIVMVSSVTGSEKGFSVTTPAGAKLEFGPGQVGRLDYSKGRLDYLSDLEPVTLVSRANLQEEDRPEQQHVIRDQGPKAERTPLTLGGVAYSKGLALKAYTEMVFDLKGDYREFAAVIGLDDNSAAAEPMVLVVEGDGKELASLTVNPADKKRFQPLKLNIKDVNKLRVIVKTSSLLDVGSLDLADAKVSK